MPIVNHPVVPPVPDDDTPIWRFMSLSKFLSLLESKSLYFPQVKVLLARDPFEGKFASNRAALAEHIATGLHESSGDPAAVTKFRRIATQILDTSEQMAQHVAYVSCWNISEFESAALWSVYAQESEGIAIRSTVGRIRAALRDSEREVMLGRVQYRIGTSDHVHPDNIFRLVYSKRASFSFENELRACVAAFPVSATDSAFVDECRKNPPGLLLKCDIGQLIQTVHVAPFSPAWFHGLVEQLVPRYGFGFDVRRSSISDSGLT